MLNFLLLVHRNASQHPAEHHVKPPVLVHIRTMLIFLSLAVLAHKLDQGICLDIMLKPPLLVHGIQLDMMLQFLSLCTNWIMASS